MRRILLVTLALTALVAAMAMMSCSSGGAAAPDCVDGESKPCTTTCSTTGVQLCATGAWGECLSSAIEECNGADDNCDGQVDEGLTAETCVCGVATGTKTCAGGTFSLCTAGDPSTAELCNNKDDDCDGQVDEDLTKPCTTDCGDGVQTCYYGDWGDCDAPAAGVEICDGKDNDCNGEVDDGLGDLTCGLGECEHTAPACVGGVAGACDPMEGAVDEICDQVLDNDCDGETDEGLAGCCTEGEMGECSTNEGECEKGTATCDAAGAWGDCTGVLPVDEVCDGKDNDCDGDIDDGNPDGGAVCGSDVGECEKGIETCVDGSITCQGEKTDSNEVCDGFDNDCNDEIDDGLGQDEFEVNESCSTGFELPDIEEVPGDPLNFAGNLYKTDGSDDQDWYKVHFSEASDWLPPCGLGLWPDDMCYVLAIVLMEAPDADQELCIKFGECGEPEFEDCAGPGDEIDVGWAGSWGGNDDKDVYIQVAGDQSCGQYAVQVTPYSVCPDGDGVCPWEEGYVAPTD